MAALLGRARRHSRHAFRSRPASTARPAWDVFWRIKFPLILPTVGVVAVLTFVGNFNAFDLIYASQGRAGPGRTLRPTFWARFSFAPFLGFSSRRATRRWARRLPG